jgi:tetratricopeptide (TPR) repeat protein
MNRGVALHEQGRFEEAVACYDRILSFRPEFAPAWNDRGAALIRMGRFEDALAALDEALALDPDLADARANRQGVVERLGKDAPIPQPIEFEPAILPRATQRLVLANLALAPIPIWREAPPHSADDFASFGTALLDEDKPEAAQAAFAKAITLGAGAEAHMGRLLAMQARQDPRLMDEAVRVLAAHPEVPRVALAVAAIREDAGDRSGAAQALKSILGPRPDLAWVWSWLGRLYLNEGRTADALQAFERAVAEDSTDDEAWANLAAALHIAGRTQEALSACESGLAVAADSPELWNNKAVVLVALGRIDDAEEALRRATSGGNGIALLNRARLAETQGQLRGALALYEEVLKVLLNDPDALAGRRRVIGSLGARGRAKRDRMIERLASIPGIGPATAARILKAGFDTPAKIQDAKELVLRELAKLTKDQARAVKRAFTR